jgi:uncharacterized protein YodC (DUF2158 family)
MNVPITSLSCGDAVHTQFDGREMTVRGIIGDGTYPSLENRVLYTNNQVMCEWIDSKTKKFSAAAFDVSGLAVVRAAKPTLVPFQMGDGVQLRSGGPILTVVLVIQHLIARPGSFEHMPHEPWLVAGHQVGDVLCRWKSKGGKKDCYYAFHSDMLVSSSPAGVLVTRPGKGIR